jgi:hypothetical protein
MRIRVALRGTAITAATLAFVGVGCEMPSSIDPSVEIAMNLPLLDKRIELGEEIDSSSTDILENPLNPGQLQIHLAKDEIDLGDDGKIGGDRLSVSDQAADDIIANVGLINVDDVDPETTPSQRFADLAPDVVGGLPPISTIPTLPGQTLPKNTEPVDFKSIQAVTFTTSEDPNLNRVDISVANHLPMALGPIEVFLSNTGDTTAAGEILDVYAQVSIPVVAAGDSVTADPFLLNGVTVRSPTYVVTQAVTQPATNVPTAELVDGYFTTTVDISALQVESAVAKIPAQKFERTESVNFASDRIDLIKVDLAEVANSDSNRFILRLENGINTDIDLAYDIPDFTISRTPAINVGRLEDLSPGSDWSNARLHLSAGEVVEIEYDLDGAVIQNASTLGGVISDLQVLLTVDILGTGEEFVDIKSTDSVLVLTDVSALAIRRVDGRIPADNPISINIDPFELSVDMKAPDGIKAIHAQAISTTINFIAESAQVDAEVRLIMDVTDVGGNSTASYERVIRSQISPGTVVSFKTTEDSVGVNGNYPLDVLNAMMDNVFEANTGTIELRGEVVMRGPVMLIRDESRIEVRDMVIDAPLQFDVPALTFDAKSDSSNAFDLDLSEGVRNDLIPHVIGAAMVVDLENHFPLGGELVMFLSPDPLLSRLRSDYPAEAQTPVGSIPSVIPTSVSISDTASVKSENAVYKLFSVTLPEPTRLANGSVDHSQPGDSTVIISLDEDELQLFSIGPTVYLLPRIQLEDAPGIVQLKADDYLDVSIWMQLKASTGDIEVDLVGDGATKLSRITEGAGQ